MTAIKPIHPFPARMAPEIALREIAALPPRAVVLDPMLGSGTVVRVAVEQGHHAIGRDMDPLAVLMAKVWTTPLDSEALRASAVRLVAEAKQLQSSDTHLPWIDDDAETRAFVDYWFSQPQQDDVRRLAALLIARSEAVDDALRLALSRIIITKDVGASLARDASHSRPHRVAQQNAYSVMDGFLLSVERLARRLS
jgi:cytochrome c556